MPEREIDWRAEVRVRLTRASDEAIDAAHEAEIVEELAQHLEDQYAEMVGRGVNPAEARERLLRQLEDPASRFPDGILERSRGRSRPSSTPIGNPPNFTTFIESAWHDAVHAARTLARTPGFATVIVLSLGIAIGANTAIFGLLDAVMLRRLDLPHPGQLVALRPMNHGYPATLVYDDFNKLRESPGLPAIEAYRPDAAAVVNGADRSDLWIDLVSGGYFDLLGVPPLLGRTISPADAKARLPVVVVSEDYWRQHLGADRGVLGRLITINDMPFTLIGVMPRRFRGIFFAHVFTVAIPIETATLYNPSAEHFYVGLLARLPHGASDAPIGQRLSTTFVHCCLDDAASSSAGARRAGPEHQLPDDGPLTNVPADRDSLNATPHIQLVDASRGLRWRDDYRARYAPVLLMLMGGVGILLLIACANIGTLLLVRAEGRQREFGVRMALGASRTRIVRQLLIESGELAIAGALVGLALSWAGTVFLLHSLPASALPLGAVIEWRVGPAILAFTSTVVVGCTVLAGAWPARRATRADIRTPLTGSDRALRRSRGWSIEEGLSVAQLSLALGLVSAAGLFVTTLTNLERWDGGYHTRSVLLARVSGDDLVTVWPTMVADLQQVPGVDAAGASTSAPVISDALWWLPIELPPGIVSPQGQPPVNWVTTGYFAATGIGMMGGREFDNSDRANGELVAIVSQAFAARYYPARNPVGVSLVLPLRERLSVRIVGVAHDGKYRDLRDDPTEMVYFPLTQKSRVSSTLNSLALAVRTEKDPVAIAPSVRRVIAAVSPESMIRRIASVGQLLDDGLARERFAAALGALFGAVALGLALLGVYGVIAYAVVRRTSEIGVRLALGAAPRDALWLVMRRALGIAGIGILIGTPFSLLAGRAIASQLYGVGATSPLMLAASASLLTTAALLASFVPGRRAAHVDPVVALRAE